MNKLNLPPFYVGQKVVKKTAGTIHIVDSIFMVDCGCWVVESSSFKFECGCNFCGDCNKTVSPVSGSIWMASDLAPIQEQKFPLMTFSKIVETEKEEILINN